jgi:NADH-quinone oxidoreductase subunit M
LDKLTATGAPAWTLEFNRIWIERLGINFHLALDGLSVLMLLLTGGLGLGAVMCSWREIDRHVGFFYLNLLWNLGGVIGVFLAVDMFLFFFFWELMLVPMYFLIALWGHNAPDGKGRIYAANKFFHLHAGIWLAAVAGHSRLGIRELRCHRHTHVQLRRLVGDPNGAGG